MEMETAIWVLLGIVVAILVGLKIAEAWNRAKGSMARIETGYDTKPVSSAPRGPMPDRSREYNLLVEHLQSALKLAGDLEQSTLAFLIDRAIDEARAQAVTFLPADRLQ